MGATCWIPALATIASSRPNRSIAASTTALLPAGVREVGVGDIDAVHVPAVFFEPLDDAPSRCHRPRR